LIAHHFDHALRRRAGGEKRDELAVAIEQEGVGGVVDDVGLAAADRNFLEEDLERRRNAPNLFCAAGQRDEARMKRGCIVLQHGRRIPLGIERDQ